MADPLYLFDGWNLLHAGGFASPEELVDRLADFVALRGVDGVVVFDGEGASQRFGRLKVRFAAHADDVVERLAAGERERREVIVVSTDRAIRETAGLDVRNIRSDDFAGELGEAERRSGRAPGGRVEDALTPDVRERLERWRRRRA